MSDINRARSVDTQVVFNGVDISLRVNKDLMSMTYTDNEEDGADDLQIKVGDPEGMWLTKWLADLTESAASAGEIINTVPETSGTSTSGSGGTPGGVNGSSGGSGTGNSTYKVTASTGVNVRSNTASKAKTLGKLPYGTVVTVHSISGEYAKVDYSGDTGYIKAANLVPLGNTGRTSKSSTSSSYARTTNVDYTNGGNSSGMSDWKVGDEVIATGNPQYSSWGVGTPGAKVTDWKGKISNLNLQPGIPYPICVDYLGWFAENQVQKTNPEEQKPKEKPAGKGLKISAAITRRNFLDDGKDDILDCGVFELDSVTADSSQGKTVTIKATSVPYSCSIRQTLKSRSWENISLSGIVKEIADNNGFAVMYEVSADPRYSRVEQYRQSDIAFLSKLCHDCGASLKFTNNIIVIFDQAKYENKKAVRVIKYGKEYESYRLSTGTNSMYTSCRVSYTAPNGTVISAVEYSEDYKENSDKNQCLEVHQKVGSIAEAQELAHKTLRLYNKYEYEASFTFPGDTALAAGCAVELSGFGAWNGKYIIKQAKHSISRSAGYTTQITLRKALPETAAPAAVPTGDTDAEIDALARQCIRGDWDNNPVRKQKLIDAGHDYDRIMDRVNQILYG